ncbi:hypothetical protein CsSME_00037000 [Camellia sinensis var. sinensis]
MEGISRDEFIGSLRRKSSAFSRGVSKYRGVARHHHNGRWEARIGILFGNKYLYLGTYDNSYYYYLMMMINDDETPSPSKNPEQLWTFEKL